MKHIFIDVNTDVIIVRLRFVQQDWEVWIQEGGGGHSRSKVVLCIIYFHQKHVRGSFDTTRLVIKCSILHDIIQCL
jgi:hypothetical protein